MMPMSYADPGVEAVIRKIGRIEESTRETV